MSEKDSGSMRINKFLSAVGWCSRREADRLIEEGAVTVDGRPAVLGTLVGPGEHVRVRGQDLGTIDAVTGRKPVLIAVNKPVGIVCTTTDNDHAENIVELVDYPERVYPIGRLDKDSEGLILLTNEGDLVNEILRGSNYHEKEYLVRVDKALTEGFVDHMRHGVHLDELQITTRPCRVAIVDRTSFTIVLTQGLNRQIRRMCEALGFHVVSLKRIRIMNIRLGSLKTGTWRNVTAEERKELIRSLKKDEEKRAARCASGAASGRASLKGAPSGGTRGINLAWLESGGHSRNASGRNGAHYDSAERRREENYKERQKEYFRKKHGALPDSPDRRGGGLKKSGGQYRGSAQKGRGGYGGNRGSGRGRRQK